MALIKCRECGNQISTEAAACPRCGAPQRSVPPRIPLTVAREHAASARPPKKSVGVFRGCFIVVLGLVVLGAIVSSVVQSTKDAPPAADMEPPASPVASMDALDQAVFAFEGGYTRAQIKERLDRALSLYGLPLTEENYSRAGSTLVALRKENRTTEMAILDHMIRSHVPGVKVDFPKAAGLSSAFLALGDK